ncbi:MAG: tetratricopeptide repeat protein, partial [Bacteroidota bacterium]
NYYAEIYQPLCNEIFEFSEEKKEELDEYKKLNRWILESRWVDAHPIYSKLASITELTPYQRSSLEVIIGQIELYYFPDSKVALKVFEKARETDKDNRRVEKAFAEYDLQCVDTPTAKSRVAGLLFQYNDDYAIYNLMGDCFKQEKSYPSAEQFYLDGCKQNIVQTDSYSSLIKLYSEAGFIQEKADSIPGVIQRIKKLESNSDYDNSLYNACRDAAAGYMSNNNFKEAEKLYNKAIALKPLFVTAYIDKAYLKFRLEKYEEAEQLLNHSLSLDPDCFDSYWALSYLYEAMPDKQSEALKAYEKCRLLRPSWADQVCNFIGNLYFKSGDFEKALSLFEEAISLNPSLPVYKENKADALISIAQQKDKDGKSEEADKLFASIDAEGNADALNTIGNHYFQKKMMDKAEIYFKKANDTDNSISIYHENLGSVYEELGMDKEAEEKYRQACELEKESGGPFNTLGYFYFIKGQWEDAIRYYTIACEKDNTNSTYLQNLIRAYGDSGQLDEALKFSKDLLTLESNAENQAQYAFYLSGSGKLDEALAEAKTALKKDNKSVYVLKTIANIYEKTGNIKKAMEFYKEAIAKSENKDDYSFNQLGILYYKDRKLEDAISCYKAALEINPDVLVYNDNLALAYEGLQRYDEAEAGYKKVIELDENNANGYNNLGVVQYRQGRLDEAEENYLKAVAHGGETPVYIENLGVLNREKGELEKAAAYFEKLVAMDKTNPVNQNDLGVLYYQTGLTDKAIDQYFKAIELKPEIPLYHENLGIAYEAKGDKENALSNYQQALSLEQDKPRLYNRLGIFYYSDKQFDKAIEYYKQAVAGEPKNEIYVENLVLALIGKGDQVEEEIYLQQLLKINPNHFNAWNELGIISYNKGKNKQAIKYYEKALTIDGSVSTILENIALAYTADKQYDKAIEYYQKAIDMNPENVSALKASLAELNNLKQKI